MDLSSKVLLSGGDSYADVRIQVSGLRQRIRSGVEHKRPSEPAGDLPPLQEQAHRAGLHERDGEDQPEELRPEYSPLTDPWRVGGLDVSWRSPRCWWCPSTSKVQPLPLRFLTAWPTQSATLQRAREANLSRGSITRACLLTLIDGYGRAPRTPPVLAPPVPGGLICPVRFLL